MEEHARGVYAILDIVADDLIGVLQIHKHEASAIRTFGDIANMKDSLLARHPHDFDMIRLGFLNEKHQLIDNYKVVITGKQWAAAQQQADGSTDGGIR